MKDTFSAIGCIVIFLFLIGLIVWWEYSVWTECRAFGHSWYYCFDLLGRK